MVSRCDLNLSYWLAVRQAHTGSTLYSLHDPTTGSGSPPRSPHTLVFRTPERQDLLSPGSLRMASDPGIYDVLGEEEAIGELPYP